MELVFQDEGFSVGNPAFEKKAKEHAFDQA
jgi:hypothetical protein